MARCSKINPQGIWRSVLCAGVFLLAPGLYGCGHPNALVGTWEEVDGPSRPTSSVATIVEFHRDGTVAITDRVTGAHPASAAPTSYQMTAVGTYTVHSDQVTIRIMRESYGRDLAPGQAILQWFRRTFTGHAPPSPPSFGPPGYKPPPLIFTFHRSGDALTLSSPVMGTRPVVTLHRA